MNKLLLLSLLSASLSLGACTPSDEKAEGVYIEMTEIVEKHRLLAVEGKFDKANYLKDMEPFARELKSIEHDDQGDIGFSKRSHAQDRFREALVDLYSTIKP